MPLLNLSNAQIAKELEISEPTIQHMTEKLREGIAEKKLVYVLATKLNSMKFI